MINIFHHPSSLQFPLQANIPSYYTSEILNTFFKHQDILHILFYSKSSNVIFFFSRHSCNIQKEEKKKKRRKKYEMKKRRRQKERRKEKEEKKKERNKKVKRRRTIWEKYHYHVNTYLHPLLPFHFPHCLYQVYHSTPSLPNSIYPFLPSSSTSFRRIIRHQWYLYLYIISNFFIC